ncbi:MAG: hypothetical protein LBS10_04325 [Gracilibacteraceae bacterium]|nr:hypothetical protein [Gracilibacteraceae bacterium]
METLRSVMEIIVKFVTFGGSLWLVWGVVILAGGLKDKNGPALQSGLWQIVGGGHHHGRSGFFPLADAGGMDRDFVPSARLSGENDGGAGRGRGICLKTF